MSVKHFCDRCGKETPFSARGQVTASRRDHSFLANDICEQCSKELLEWWRSGKQAKQTALDQLEGNQLGTIEHLRIAMAGMDPTNYVYAKSSSYAYRIREVSIDDGHTTGEARDGTAVEQDTEPSLWLELEVL